MKNLDLYWRSDKAWWEFKNHIPVLKNDAPPEAKASYAKYLEQTKKKR